MKQRKKSFGMRISAFVLSFAMVCTLLAGVNVVAFAADGELTDTVAVQKFYWNPAMGGSGEHIYTVDEDEIDYYSGLSDWNNEGDAWNAPLMSDNPVYRLCNYNTGEHIWVADKGYADLLVEQGWTIEQGIAFYSADADGVPVYRLWNGTDGVGCHHYTTNEEEIIGMQLAGWKLEDVAFYGVKEEEPGEKEMTAVQTGAKEITVTTDDAFTGAEEFTVLKGISEQAFEDEPMFSEDMKTVIITLEDEITASEYTVICSDEEYVPDSFLGEAAELTTVLIGDTLIPYTAQGAPANAYNVFVATLDQFGDDYTVDAWDATVFSNATFANWDGELGVLTVTNANAKVGETTTISLVEGTLVTNGSATFSAASAPSTVLVSDLKMSDAEALANQTGRVDVDDLTNNVGPIALNERYYYEVTVLDQYGLPMSADQLNAATAKSTLVVSDGNKVITPCGTKGTSNPYAAGTIFDTDDEGNVIMPVTSGTNLPGAGSISIIPVANPTGQDEAEAVIAPNEALDTITVSKALSNLQIGTPVPVVVSATNNFGETVDMDEEVVLKAGSIGTTTATLQYTAGSAHSKATEATMNLTGGSWMYDEGVYAIIADGTSPIVFVMTNGKTPQQFQFTPDPAAKAAGVYGLNTVGAAGVQSTVRYSANSGAAITNIELPANVYLKDQYGNQMINYVNGKPITPKAFLGLTKGVATAIAPAGGFAIGDVFYTIGESGKHNVLEATSDGIAYKAGNTGATAVTEKFTLTAWVCTAVKNQGDTIGADAEALPTYNFSVTVAGKEYVDFVAMFVDDNTLPKDVLYTGGTFDTTSLVVYGVDAQSNMVPLLVNGQLLDDKLDVDDITSTSKATIANNNGALTVTSPAAINVADPTTVDDGTYSIEIWYDGVYYDDVEITTSNLSSIPEEVYVEVSTDNGTTYVPYDISKGFAVSDNATIALTKSNPWDGTDNIVITDGTTVYRITTIDQYGFSYIESADYAGNSVGNATPVQVGSKTLSIKAGILSKNVVVTATTQQ